VNKTTTTTAAALIAGMMAIAGSAWADDADTMGGKRGERLKQLDTNGDQMISKEEAAADPMLTKRFDSIDANGDGQITREEMRAAMAAHKGDRRSDMGERKGGHGPEQMFAKLDKNGDGVITRDEVAGRARLEQRFDTLDANKDGQLTKEEMMAAHPRSKG